MKGMSNGINDAYIAIIDPNTLSALGLRGILQNIMPMMSIDTFGSFSEFEANSPEKYFHYFAHVSIVLSHMAFFSEHTHKTIVLTQANASYNKLGKFHCIFTNQPEKQLIKSFLRLEQHGHAHGRNLPQDIGISVETGVLLSAREIEVLSLIVKGFINKEIASKLNISMATVITHRKNLMGKLGLKSLSSLTIYAVMNGYVDINEI